MLRNYLLCCIVFLFCSEFIIAQNFEWVKSFGSKYYEEIYAVAADSSGGCSFLLNYDGFDFNNPDTLRLGAFQFYKGIKAEHWTIFVKLDANGNVTKARKLANNGTSGTFGGNRLACRDGKGNIYFLVTSRGAADSFYYDSVLLYQKKGAFIYTKYDKNGNKVFIKQSGSPYTIITDLSFSEGHLFFWGYSRDISIFGTDTFKFSKKLPNSIFGEIDAQSGEVLWSGTFYDSLQTTMTGLTCRGMASLKGSVFMAGQCMKKFKLKGDTFYNGAYLIQLDGKGKYKKGGIYMAGHPSNDDDSVASFTTLNSDGENLYLSGRSLDSFVFSDKKYVSQFPNSAYWWDQNFLSYDSSVRRQWLYMPKVLDKTKGYKILGSATNEGYNYYMGWVGTKLDLQGIPVSAKSTFDALILKLDYKGNILWAVNGGANYSFSQAIDAIAGKYVFLSGSFKDTLKFGKEILVSNSRWNDGWIAKLSDNSIFRGKVNKGPYCAGDSIRVNYTKTGTFDTSNYFIAQLSDEFGRFDSLYYELGRIKSNSDGVIKGTLPMFHVKSSPLYRIRILSTSPAVQSFYRVDTLRLLIYSKDKADPGPPETICKGDSIMLNTYGGTKWNWSPNYNINNTSLRQPIVWPLKDTTYKIIIADSSGCGKPDTAFKKIFVRQYPKTLLKFTDTAICQNLLLKIPAKFTGGDSNYHWQMFFVTPTKWFFYKSGNSGTNDTLSYTTGVDATNDDKMAIILKDGCTSKADTTYLTVRLRKSLSLKSRFSDTLLCYGNKLIRIAKPASTLPAYAFWQWKDITHQTVLSTSDTLNIIAKQTIKIMLSLSNGCVSDTNSFTLYVNQQLKAVIQTGKGTLHDTTLCYGQSLKLNTFGRGGSGSGYNFKWYLDKSLVSTSDTFNLKSDVLFVNTNQTKTLTLHLSDNCSAASDSISVKISVIPTPKADFTNGLTCNLNPIQFTFTGTKPAGLTTSFNWDFAGEGTSSLENPTQKISAGMRKITLKANSSNGCQDVLTKDVDIKPQAQADFIVDDVCEDTQAVFNNKTTVTSGTANYLWFFGDGKTSNSDNPFHQYQISGITKTFNVKLRASVPNGCSDSITKAVTVNASPKQGFSYLVNFQTVNFSANESNGTSYKWSFGDGGTATTNKREHSYTYSKFPSGKYKACLEVTNLAGCKSDTCLDIQIWGGVEPIKPKKIKIYPNPNNGNFIVEILKFSGNSTIQIIDCHGKLVHQQISLTSQTQINLDLSKGIYLIKVTDKNNTYVQRILVNHD